MNGIVLLIEALLALILISSFAPLTKTSLQNDFADLIEEKKLGDLSNAVSQDEGLSTELINFAKTGFPPRNTMELANQVSSKCLQVIVNEREYGDYEKCADAGRTTRLKSIATLFDGNEFYSVKLILSD
ncbi:hypothetical protein HY993_01905 [Candidatus Micrarchaeota archaeon]|nr:hypothetical protein [Candidatus Micrarchaeota archaeon]